MALNVLPARPRWPSLALDLNEFRGEHHPEVIRTLVSFVQGDKNIASYCRADNRVRQLIVERKLASDPPENILLTNGADDAIRLVVDVLRPSRCLVLTPTYQMYAKTAAVYNVPVVELPFSTTLDNLSPLPNDLVFICSPNNPTGELVDGDRFLQVARRFPAVCFLLDRCYGEFAATQPPEEVAELSNVLVVRSFSKAFGLANLRIGYLTGPLVPELQRSYNSKNVSGIAQEAAAAVLQHSVWYLVQAEDTAKRTRRMAHDLALIDPKVDVQAGPGSNFACLTFENVPASVSCRIFLMDRGVLVRDISERMPNTLRVTTGSDSDTAQLLDAFRCWAAMRAVRLPSPVCGEPPFLCICVTERKDRFEAFQKLGLEGVQFIRPHRDTRGGEIGCWQSHKQAMIEIVRSGAPWGLVLEDDVVFDEPVSSPRLRQLIAEFCACTPSWDVLRLGSLIYAIVGPSQHPSVWQAVSNHSHAICYSRGCAIRCLEDPLFDPLRKGSGVDDYIRLSEGIKDFAFVPSLCYQREESASDNRWFQWDPFGVQHMSLWWQRTTNRVAWGLRWLPVRVQHALNPWPCAVSVTVTVNGWLKRWW